jgi:aspartate aminotransferase-like enzyme
MLISAPQKGWSASPCSALVMLGDEAMKRIPETRSTSFACDLLKWLQIMQAYENGQSKVKMSSSPGRCMSCSQYLLQIRAHGRPYMSGTSYSMMRPGVTGVGVPSIG